MSRAEKQNVAPVTLLGRSTYYVTYQIRGFPDSSIMFTEMRIEDPIRSADDVVGRIVPRLKEQLNIDPKRTVVIVGFSPLG